MTVSPTISGLKNVLLGRRGDVEGGFKAVGPAVSVCCLLIQL